MTMTVFGYMVIISIDFYDLISPFSPKFWFQLRRYIKHSGQCLTTFPNTLKFVKNTLLHVLFSTLFSVFGNVVKHGLFCLIYYIKHSRQCFISYPNTSNFIKNTLLHVILIFFTLILVFGYPNETLSLMFDMLLQIPKL